MIDFIEIPVSDLKASTAFYSSILDVALLRDERSNIGQFALFPPGDSGITVILVQAGRVSIPSGPMIQVYFPVRGSVSDAVARAVAFGGEALDGIFDLPQLGEVRFVRDPDGHRIGLRRQRAGGKG